MCFRRLAWAIGIALVAGCAAPAADDNCGDISAESDRLAGPPDPRIAQGYTPDASPDNSDSDVGCYPSDASRGDGIRDGNDMYWMDCDADRDEVPDGEDPCVDQDRDGMCEFNGEVLSEWCRGDDPTACARLTCKIDAGLPYTRTYARDATS